MERRDVLARSLSRARFPSLLCPNFRRVLISRDWWGKASLFPRFHTCDSFRATLQEKLLLHFFVLSREDALPELLSLCCTTIAFFMLAVFCTTNLKRKLILCEGNFRDSIELAKNLKIFIYLGVDRLEWS